MKNVPKFCARLETQFGEADMNEMGSRIIWKIAELQYYIAARAYIVQLRSAVFF